MYNINTYIIPLLLILFNFQINEAKSDIPYSDVPRLQMPVYDSNGTILAFPRIVGGQPAQLGEYPGKLSLQDRLGRHFCGGTLIDDRHVLTAAHCLTTAAGAVLNPGQFQVMGDDLRIQSPQSSNRQIRTITHIFVHPQYSVRTLENDIAVMRIVSSFTQTPTFYPVNRIQSRPPVGQFCTVAGWGATYENGTASPMLLRVSIEIIATSVCNSRNSYNGLVRQNMFCAGSMDGGRDSCQGDSGGGVICQNQVSGIVSFGNGCGLRNFPGVYTEVSAYNNWINMVINWNGSAVPTPTTVRPGGGTSSLLASIFCIFVATLISITNF